MRRTVGLAALGAASAVLVCAPAKVEAQTVVGRVLERGGGGPVAGAMVRLVASDGGTAGEWLTGADGRFRIVAAGAGSFRLSVERIGFATTTIDDVELVDNGFASIDAVVETEAIALEGLEVSTRGGQCAIPGAGAAQTLWDEARKALDAARWTADRITLRIVADVWDRQLDPRTSQILYEERDERETVGSNSVRSLPPADLEERGYVRIDPAFTYYYAPDADALLSDGFRDTHCFRVVEDDDDRLLIGLAFEPKDDRDVPDIEGVLWLDTENGRLDRVEFSYTGLDMPGADRARGEVRWTELSNGQWIVRAWSIHSPMGGQVGVGTPGRLRRQGRMSIHEVGSEVVRVEGDGVAWRPDMAPGSLRGVVYDSVSRGTLPGATVRIAGRPLRASSGLSGRYELAGVPPGLHRVTFGHPRLDSLGITPGWVTARVGEGETVEVDLVVPSWLTLLARSCAGGGAGAFVGIVRTRDGEPAPGARVEVTSATRPDGEPYSDVADHHGAFVLCDLPTGVTRVVARRAGATSEPTEARVSTDRWVQGDLVLPPRVAPTSEVVPGAFRPALVGHVLVHGSRAPLSDVTVELLDAEGDVITATLTEEDGSFRALLDQGAEVYLSVRRLGFTGAVSEALDVTEGTRRIEILMPEEAIEIEPVVVVVEGRDPRLELEGFYQRALSTGGMFIRRDDVEAVAPARTSDLLGRAPGVLVRSDPMRADLRRRVTFQRLALTGGDRCWPSVYVDGEMVRVGGSRQESEAPVIEGIEPLMETNADVPSLDELVPPQEILAVEMYPTPGQVPRRFVGLGTHCGVIVIWTTRR